MYFRKIKTNIYNRRERFAAYETQQDALKDNLVGLETEVFQAELTSIGEIKTVMVPTTVLEPKKVCEKEAGSKYVATEDDDDDEAGL